VIRNGVDLTRFQPPDNHQIRQEIRQLLGIDVNDKLVITVGAVEPRKGTDLLLKAWIRLAAKYPDVHLVIVGPRADLTNPAYETFHRKLETLLAAVNMPSHIHFVGQVERVEKYLQAADIFAFTSLREGFPNVVLEAMATGLPVVSTPFIGLSEELGRANEHFLLADRNPDSFSEALDELIRMPSLQQQLGKSARNWVKTHMDLEQSLDQFASLYREMARSSARTPVSVQ
jgi:glycosyltransferase involved in cell wall biosynthesis